MKNKIIAAGLFVALAGCATVSQMTATGGSRADGVVRLSYELGVFDKARIDEADALRTAQARCRTWGYNDAEAFGGVTRQCQAPEHALIERLLTVVAKGRMADVVQ